MAAFEGQVWPNGGVSNVPGRKTLVLEIVYGASGAASAIGKNFQLVNNTATGKITITFDRTYRHLKNMNWGWKVAGAGAVLTPVILTNNISTADTNGGGTVIIETRASAGTATNPSNGDKLTLWFDVTNDALSDDGAVTVT
jgi:hypothetical protein